MHEHHERQQSRALQTLLAIEDPYEQPRSKVNSRSGKENKHKLFFFHQRSGKENIMRRDFLPKVNNNKQQLKSILKRLESTEISRGEGRPLKVLKKIQNMNSHTCGLKTLRSQKVSQCSNSRKGQESKSILELTSGDDIKTLMRKKNYSTNALNLKTMHILQQLNSKNSRNFSLSIRTQDKSNSKKMIAFLRRVA